MITNCGTPFVQWRPFPVRTVCFGSPSTAGNKTEQLRQQLDHLHNEAENTRAKANSARLRLMRLSEAAEKLRRHAAVSVQTGKENDARELLFQKNKVMQAMEKSKSRIEVLDKLFAKLNEAISVKEGQLIGNVALDLEVGGEEACSPVRIVSPKGENLSKSDENLELDSDPPNFGEDPITEALTVSASQEDLCAQNDLNNCEGPDNDNGKNEVDNVLNLNNISSFEDLVEHIDGQLNRIQVELQTFLRFSDLILEGKEKLENSKVQHAVEIVEGIRNVRERIASIIQAKV